MVTYSPLFSGLTLIQRYLLPIILDTSASLSISLYKMIFLVPITHLPEPRTLEDMVNVTLISAIGIVQCILNTGDTFLTIHTHFYHIPNDRDLLLRPQILFSGCGVAIGTFTISDKCGTLFLDGKPSLQILYDSRLYLPVSLARNFTASVSPNEVNLSVLSDNM